MRFMIYDEMIRLVLRNELAPGPTAERVRRGCNRTGVKDDVSLVIVDSEGSS